MENNSNPEQPTEPPKENKLPKECILNFHPQRQRFDFDELTIDTLFDSANLATAIKYKDFHYHLTIAPDAYLTASQTGNKTWFYFRITQVKNPGTYTFTMKNMNRQIRLFESGLAPVFRAIPSCPEWNTISPQTILLKTVEKDIEMTFTHTLNPSDKETYIAFTYPWSYTDDQEYLNQIESQLQNDEEIYFHREVLAYSRENRKIELLTITSHSNKLEQREEILPNLFPYNSVNPRPFRFENKKYVFISARVHPGETPASYTLKGLLKFLLDKNDQRAKVFRDKFVMVMVPMLNPDGVSRGHYRMDTSGLNLNRFYKNPTIEQHPSIYAAKEIVMYLHNRGDLFLYCDLHAHATVRSCFVYGNSMSYREQIEGKLFAKILSLNSRHFEYSRSDFSETNVSVDKGDGKDKGGAGRVALYKATNNPRVYTLECNYGSGKIRNIISEIAPTTDNEVLNQDKDKFDETKLGEIQGETVECLDPYTKESFEEIGEAIGPTLLDMINQNPMSRLPTSPYKTVDNVKLHIGLSLMKDLKFKFDPFLRKINQDIPNNLAVLKKYIEEDVQLEPVVQSKKEPVVKAKKKGGFLKKTAPKKSVEIEIFVSNHQTDVVIQNNSETINENQDEANKAEENQPEDPTSTN